MSEHYGTKYDKLIARVGESSPARWRPRREMLSRYKSGGTILDLGCSSGSFLEALKGQQWELYGVEISPASAKRAAARTGARVFTGDVLNAPFVPESFDAITCFDVLEHLNQPLQVMIRIATWLKPGGIFLTFVPNIDSGAARVFRSYWYALELPRHLSHFSPDSLRFLAKSAGLEEVFLETDPNTTLEYSIRYLYDRMQERLGFSPTPLAEAEPPSILWRVVRKIFRMSIIPLISWTFSLAGDRESIYAIFRKAAPPAETSTKKGSNSCPE